MAQEHVDRTPEADDLGGRRLHKLKSLSANLLIMLGALLFTLAAAEIAVRVIHPQQLVIIRPDIWMSVDTLGWQHRPNVDAVVNTGEGRVRVITDSEGFRVGMSGRRVANDSILVIGDSFMEALQVAYEESLPGLIEDSLVGPHGEQVAVRNAGVGAWDSPQYRLFAERRLRTASYGLVLVAVMVGNDVVARAPEYYPPRPPADRARFRIPFSLTPSAWIDDVFRPLNDALEVRSHLFVLAKNATAPLRIRLGMSAAYMPRGVVRANATLQEWDVTADVLADISRMAHDANTPTLFVLLPERYQVETDMFRAHAAANHLDSAAVDLEQPNRRLVEELTARDLDVIDALPFFRQREQTDAESLYGSVDPHLSAAGHAALFQLLRADIAELLWRNDAGNASIPGRPTSGLN